MLLGTSASLLVTSALLVVTRDSVHGAVFDVRSGLQDGHAMAQFEDLAESADGHAVAQLWPYFCY